MLLGRRGVPCSVVVVETAPVSKMERMRALGAKLIPVPFDVAWQALEERAFPESTAHLCIPSMTIISFLVTDDGARDP